MTKFLKIKPIEKQSEKQTPMTKCSSFVCLKIVVFVDFAKVVQFLFWVWNNLKTQ